MKKSLVLVALILSGCAHDNYTVIPNSNGSQVAMADDLRDCKVAAWRAYHDSRSNSGAYAGLGAFGAIGGAIAGLATAADNTQKPEPMKVSDINPYTEKCMIEKGYSGTSN